MIERVIPHGEMEAEAGVNFSLPERWDGPRPADALCFPAPAQHMRTVSQRLHLTGGRAGVHSQTPGQPFAQTC